jgi:predicted RNA methylase
MNKRFIKNNYKSPTSICTPKRSLGPIKRTATVYSIANKGGIEEKMCGKNNNTPRNRRILDLLNEPESVDSPSNYMQSDNGLKVLIGEPLALPPSQRKIFFSLARKGRIDIDTLVYETGLSLDEVESSIETLMKRRYIIEDNEKFFVKNYFWEQEIFPAGPHIPLIYHYNLLSDNNRVSSFVQAIENNVKEGDVVIDLGAGVGILSLIAAKKAKKVYAIEVDPAVAKKGDEITKTFGMHDNIEYILSDARDFKLPEKVDVIICEMIDTGLIAELQVPVMNESLSLLKSNGGRVIPLRAKSTVQLIQTNYSFYNYEFRLPHFEEYGARHSIDVLSSEKTYHIIEFDKKNDTQVNRKIEIDVESKGKVNGVRIKTYVEVDKNMWVEPSPWFNAPLVLPFSSTYDVKPGGIMEISLLYKLGGGFETLHWRGVKLIS